MKIIYKIFLLALVVYFSAFSQITEITRFPFQSRDKEYFESSPVVISENVILLFYCTGNSKVPDYWARTNDTLYFSKSTDGGLNWNSPIFISELGKLEHNRWWFLTSLKTTTGRIILAWTDWESGNIDLIHSDDDGLSWSEKAFISSFPGPNYLNLSELNNGRILISHVSELSNRVYYNESFDRGETWSQTPVTFYSGSNRMRNLSFISMPTKLLAFFEYDSSGVTQHSGIFYRESTNNGLSWSANIIVIDSPWVDNRPKVIKLSDNQLWLIYQVDEILGDYFNLNDIYSVKSNDGGQSWLAPEQFTSYAGDDNFLQTAKVDDKVFITFATTRYTNEPQLCYAKLGETVESYRPPFIESATITSDSLKRKEYIVSAVVVDDEKVVWVKASFDDGTTAELFDDGKHDDGDSLDNTFANIVVFNSLPPSTESVIDVNKLILPFGNGGILADVRVSFSQNSVLEAVDNVGDKCEFNTNIERTDIILARYEEGTFLFSGGFFLSGFTNGQLWSNAAASASLVEDYLPGRVGSDRNDPLNKIYIVYNDDPPFGYSWQRWRDAVSLGAEFYDGDNNGVYNPTDKNFNGTWEANEDMPMLLGDVTAWCVYNDARPKEMRRWNTVDPQGIEVRQTIFAANQPELENVIFIRYSILNTGTVAEIMDSVYFGVWEDADVGDYTDDVVGCDTILQSGFYYNNDTDYVYGNNQPSFFTSLLQGPVISTNNPSDTAINNSGELIGSEAISSAKNLDMTSHVFFIGGDPNLNDPGTAVQARCYLEGKTRLCETPDPCTFPCSEVRSGVNCNEINPHLWFSGDPVTNIGWIETCQINQRNMVSTGPFILEKNNPQNLIVAYVIGRGADYFNSVTVARENVQRAIQEYESNFASMTYTPPPPTNPVMSYVLYQNYPNPFNPTTTIRYELPQDGVVTIELFDILGQKVRTILNEFKKAERYEVSFNATGLASGVYIYQLRVNDYINSKKMVLIK